MSDSPFQSAYEQSKIVGVKSGLRKDLRQIALNQRWIMQQNGIKVGLLGAKVDSI